MLRRPSFCSNFTRLDYKHKTSVAFDDLPTDYDGTVWRKGAKVKCYNLIP